MHSDAVGRGYKNTFFKTPNSDRHLFSGKLIKTAETEPPTVIINDGTFTNGIRLPPSKIDPMTSPIPNINPTMVAMSNLMTLKVRSFENDNIDFVVRISRD